MELTKLQDRAYYTGYENQKADLSGLNQEEQKEYMEWYKKGFRDYFIDSRKEGRNK